MFPKCGLAIIVADQQPIFSFEKEKNDPIKLKFSRWVISCIYSKKSVSEVVRLTFLLTTSFPLQDQAWRLNSSAVMASMASAVSGLGRGGAANMGLPP